jgi:hypothetical protein
MTSRFATKVRCPTSWAKFALDLLINKMLQKVLYSPKNLNFTSPE